MVRACAFSLSLSLSLSRFGSGILFMIPRDATADAAATS